MTRPSTPSAPGRVVLLGNYEPDRQQSMLRYARSLEGILSRRGVDVRLVQPRRRLGPPRNPHRGAGKWLAYVDKLVLFPRELRRLARSSPRNTVFHVCDHSNAPLLGSLAGRPTVVTCHDLLAVLGARGEDPWCPATRSGRRLQGWILQHLARATAVACDSTHTRNDFMRLTGRREDPRVETVLLPLNDTFSALSSQEAHAALSGRAALPLERPFLLHVGSGLPRKNRITVVRTLARARALGWSGFAVLAGETCEPALLQEAAKLGVAGDLHALEGLSQAELRALYSLAQALLLPSHGEGFGYPVIEAQACGCPVLCSDATSLPEVAGAGALLHAPLDVEGFAQSLCALSDPALRARLQAAGASNLQRFSEAAFADAMINLYASALAAAA